MRSSVPIAGFFLLFGCGRSPSTPATTEVTPPPREVPPECTAFEYADTVYDCHALDRCDDDPFYLPYRIACCECSARFCKADPTCPDMSSDPIPPPPPPEPNPPA